MQLKAVNQSLTEDNFLTYLKKVCFPVFYLDFESILTALPIYPNIAPHQTVLTQYSLHLIQTEEAELQHFEYLAPHEKDSRKELAEDLLSKLGNSGTIIVYSNYEETQLKSLAKEFPDLKEQIEACIKILFRPTRNFYKCLLPP